MGRKREIEMRDMTLGDLLMRAKVNGEDVIVTAGLLLHGAMEAEVQANVKAVECTSTFSDAADASIEQAERARASKQKEIAAKNREARRAPGSGAFKTDWKPSKGTKVTVAKTQPTLKVNKETGKLRATGASDFKRNKMTKIEFDGVKTKHDRIYVRDSSGKWVHNCASAKTYRQQVWNHFNNVRDEAGELIQPEHPNVNDVQLAAV